MLCEYGSKECQSTYPGHRYAIIGGIASIEVSLCKSHAGVLKRNHSHWKLVRVSVIKFKDTNNEYKYDATNSI